MSKTIVATFDNYNYAEKAARQIKDQGLRTDDISLVAKQEDGTTTTTHPTSTMGTANTPGTTNTTGTNNTTGATQVNDNISDGVVTGGILGGLAGLLIGAGSLVVPGLGLIAAAGPIAGLLSGTLTGGIVGGLVDLGIPETRSRQYETDVKSGKILFSMRTDEPKVEQIASILRSNGALTVESY